MQKTENVVRTQKNNPLIGLLGQPNTGKSTVFNAMTGSRQHVGNWPGKTVEKKEGTFQHGGKTYRLLDLPGTYSLSANSEEELITRQNIIGSDVDAVLALVDASQLERSMFLLAEIVGLKVPVVVLLNMMDVSRQRGREIDSGRLSELLGVPVLPLVASRGEGMDELYAFLDQKRYQNCLLHADGLYKQYTATFGASFSELTILLDRMQSEAYSSMWLAIKLLEGDKEIISLVKSSVNGEIWDKIQNILEKTENSLLTSADCKFNWLKSVAEQVVLKRGEGESKLSRFDKAATSPHLGKVIAVGVIVLGMVVSVAIGYLFMAIFGVIQQLLTAGAYSGLTAIGAPAMLTSFVCDAFITGVFFSLMMSTYVFGMCLVFGFMEEVGYMARISFVFDNAMQRLGLHGKAIMPFLVSFGCTIAGVSGTRVIDSWKQRLLAIATCWVVPCSATWGVITLMGSTFFGANAIWVILLLFAVAFLHLKITASIFGRSLSKPEDRTGIIMELPPYHKPNYKSLLKYVWLRVTDVLRRALKVILAVTIIFWFLAYSPDGNISSSLIYKFGTFIEPVTMFFGMRWELFITFLSSAIGKEASLGVVAALFTEHAAAGSVFNITLLGQQVSTANVGASLLASVSMPQALAFMFAFFFNVPCFMTVAATAGETHSTKWTLRIVFYYFGTALLMSAIVYRVALLFF